MWKCGDPEGISKEFGEGVGSRLHGFPCFPHSVISMTCFSRDKCRINRHAAIQCNSENGSARPQCFTDSWLETYQFRQLDHPCTLFVSRAGTTNLCRGAFMFLKLLVGIGVGSLLTFPVVSHADTLNFKLTEANATYTWSLPSNPVPSGATPGQDFAFFDLPISLNGSSIGASSILEFQPFSEAEGGFAICAATCLVDVHGAQIYSGTEQSPIFAVGTFQLTE